MRDGGLGNWEGWGCGVGLGRWVLGLRFWVRVGGEELGVGGGLEVFNMGGADLGWEDPDGGGGLGVGGVNWRWERLIGMGGSN